MSETDESQDTELAYLTSAVTQILRATNCPTGCRDFIDGLLSVSDGRIDFSIRDADLAEGAKTEKKTLLRESHQKWAQRRRKAIKNWQEGIGVDLITFKPGKSNPKINEYIPTSYHLPLYSYAIQVIKSAMNDEGWGRNPNAAIERAARELMNELGAKPVNIPAAKSKSRKTYDEALSKIRLARTSLATAAKILKDNDTGIYDDGEEAIEEVRQLTEELKARVGYYGEMYRLEELELDEGEE